MKIFLIICLTLTSVTTFSKTLIVSDIDDTLKVAHVRDSVDIVANAYVTTAPFRGMKDLFQSILKQNPDSEIIYVTNANDFWMKNSHTKFIRNNKFPNGKIFMRKESSDTHKYNTIKNYLLSNPAITQVLMFGDNAERDITFYRKVEKEFESRVYFKTYIRIAYSLPDETLPLEDTQVGFVSPLEVMANLTLSGFFSFTDYFELGDKLAKEMVLEKNVSSTRPQYFPEWLNCKSMKFSYYPDLMSDSIKKAYEKMETLCQ